MPNTPISLDRVIRDPILRVKVQAILDTVKPSTREIHGITLHLKRKPRALVKWGEFPPDGDALANRIRRVLGREKWEVSQVGPPSRWNKRDRHATAETPYCY